MTQLSPTQSNIRDRRAQLMAHMLADIPIKAFASTHNCSIAVIGKDVAAIGFRKMFVTDEERFNIIRERNLKALVSEGGG